MTDVRPTTPTISPGDTIRVEAKPVLASKTFWGIAIALLFSFLNKHGFNLTGSNTGEASDYIMKLIEIGAAGLAMYGRWTATRPLTVTPTTKTVTTASILFTMIIFAGGCVKTSEPYKQAIQPAIELVAKEMTLYTASNQNLSTPAKASEQQKTDALSATVKGNIEAQKVANAFAVVKPKYQAYLYADPNLPTQELKDRDFQTAVKIEQLTNEELARQHESAGAFLNFVPGLAK
jgi:hypothetical protein